MKARDLLLVVLGAVLGFASAVSYSTFAQKSEFAKLMEPKTNFTADVGYASCAHAPSPEGQWWQGDQDRPRADYKAKCGTFGFSYAVNDNWTLGMHYVSLGRVDVDAIAIAFPGDERANMTADIDPLRPECGLPLVNHEGCKLQWHTQSFTRGLNFSIARRLFDLGPVRFDGKVGLYAHKLSSHAVYEPLGCRDNCPWRGTLDQSAERISPMWGAVAKWGYLFVAWEFYERIGEHTPVTANIKGRTEVKTIGVRIPL